MKGKVQGGAASWPHGIPSRATACRNIYEAMSVEHLHENWIAKRKQEQENNKGPLPRTCDTQTWALSEITVRETGDLLVGIIILTLI